MKIEKAERERGMKKVNDNNKLAIQMLIAMVAGILVGLLFMALRESVGGNVWTTINNLLFQDITTDSSAVGLFYIGGSCLSVRCS